MNRRQAYKDPNCESPHPHPIKANSEGEFPPIYLNSRTETKVDYRAILNLKLDNDTTEEYFDEDEISRVEENFETDTIADGDWTINGFSSTPTNGDLVWYRFGRLVNVVFPAISGTSNSTAFSTNVTLPSRIMPAGTRYYTLPYATDNGSHTSAICRVNTNGAFVFAKANQAYSATSWTASGTKGIGAQNGIWYRIDD